MMAIFRMRSGGKTAGTVAEVELNRFSWAVVLVTPSAIRTPARPLNNLALAREGAIDDAFRTAPSLQNTRAIHSDIACYKPRVADRNRQRATDR